VLWPARLFPALKQLSGPEGGRRILEALAADILPLKSDNRDTALDIDTHDDLDALRERLHKQHSS
jgi:CTP:molybdopterin cytidylyltransferase MocA